METRVVDRLQGMSTCELSQSDFRRRFKTQILIFISSKVSYCEEKPSHLPDSHKKWCVFYTLYYKLLLRQKLHGRIEPILPNRILQKPTQIPDTMDEVFKMLFKNSTGLYFLP